MALVLFLYRCATYVVVGCSLLWGLLSGDRKVELIVSSLLCYE
jgi:hypothetical protein